MLVYTSSDLIRYDPAASIYSQKLSRYLMTDRARMQFDGEGVFLSQSELAELLSAQKSNISRNIKAICEEMAAFRDPDGRPLFKAIPSSGGTLIKYTPVFYIHSNLRSNLIYDYKEISSFRSRLSIYLAEKAFLCVSEGADTISTTALKYQRISNLTCSLEKAIEEINSFSLSLYLSKEGEYILIRKDREAKKEETKSTEKVSIKTAIKRAMGYEAAAKEFGTALAERVMAALICLYEHPEPYYMLKSGTAVTGAEVREKIFSALSPTITLNVISLMQKSHSSVTDRRVADLYLDMTR